MSDGALLAAMKDELLHHFKLYREGTTQKNEDVYAPYMALLLKHTEGKEAYVDDQGLSGTITRTIVNKHDGLTWARFIQTLYLINVEFADFEFVFHPKGRRNIVHGFTMQLHRNNYDDTHGEAKMPSEKINDKTIYHASILKRKQDNSIIATMIKRLYYELGYFNPISNEVTKSGLYVKLLQEHFNQHGNFGKNRKAKRAEIQNFSKDIAKTRITWKTVIRALRVAQIPAFDLKIDLKRYTGEEYTLEYNVTV